MVRNLSCSLIILCSVAAASPVLANPITGSSMGGEAPATPAAEERSRTARVSPPVDANSLFDASGLALLRVSPPTFVQLGQHVKLRDVGAPLIQQDVVVGMVSGASASVVGNLNISPAGNSLTGSHFVNNRPSVAEPLTLLLLAPAVAVLVRRRSRRAAR